MALAPARKTAVLLIHALRELTKLHRGRPQEESIFDIDEHRRFKERLDEMRPQFSGPGPQRP